MSIVSCSASPLQRSTTTQYRCDWLGGCRAEVVLAVSSTGWLLSEITRNKPVQRISSCPPATRHYEYCTIKSPCLALYHPPSSGTEAMAPQPIIIIIIPTRRRIRRSTEYLSPAYRFLIDWFVYFINRNRIPLATSINNIEVRFLLLENSVPFGINYIVRWLRKKRSHGDHVDGGKVKDKVIEEEWNGNSTLLLQSLRAIVRYPPPSPFSRLSICRPDTKTQSHYWDLLNKPRCRSVTPLGGKSTVGREGDGSKSTVLWNQEATQMK